MEDIAQERATIHVAPRRLGHGNLFVSNLERSIQFYDSVCGVKGVFREPGIMASFHSNGNSHHDIAVMQISEQPRIGKGGHVQVSAGRGFIPGLNHLGFEMENERTLVEAWQRAKTAGLKMRVTDHGMSHSVYVFDPEGNYLEFYADVIDDWRAFYAAKENQLISSEWRPDPKMADESRRYAKSFVPTVVEDAPLHPRRISRVTLLTNDLAAMVDYYRDVAGLDVVAGTPSKGYAVFAGGTGEPCVALFARGDRSPGLHHLGFEVADENAVAQGARALDGMGVPIVAQIDNASKKSIVIADPDGITLEFYAARPGPIPDPSSLPVPERVFLL